MKVPEITRMLVLTGIVTIATENGSIQAAENEAIVAKANEAPEKIIVQANSKFATKLYTQFAKENLGKNMFFSPYSVSTALTMTMEGARSQTAKEIGNVLGFSDSLIRTGDDAQNLPWQMSQIHTGSSALHKHLNQGNENPEQEEAQIQLKVANAIWAEQSYPILDSFKQTISTNYATEAFKTADFKNNVETERNRINSWVEDQTNNRIKDILDASSLDSMTKIVLVNAIYFKGDWKTQFKASNTMESDYTLTSGATTKVQLMRAYDLKNARYAAFNPDGSFFKTPIMNIGKRYPTKDGFSMVELPYHGNEVSMVVIAPNSADGLGAIESKLNSENLSIWINQMKNREIHLALPKFKSETTYNMNGTLSKMGMPTAFSRGAADFRGIDNSTSLYIDKVIHKAFIEVNEAGTEAAAATVVTDAPKSAVLQLKPFTPEFRADRPFIYLIRDTKTGTILFLGRMMNPMG